MPSSKSAHQFSSIADQQIPRLLLLICAAEKALSSITFSPTLRCEQAESGSTLQGRRKVSAFVVEKGAPGLRIGKIIPMAGRRGAFHSEAFFEDLSVRLVRYLTRRIWAGSAHHVALSRVRCWRTAFHSNEQSLTSGIASRFPAQF